MALPAREVADRRLPRPLLWLFAGMTFAGWVATVAGWYVTEIGRQPFIVYGLVRTADVASKVPSAMIAPTLALYVTLYLALIVAYVDGAEVHGREARGGARPRPPSEPRRRPARSRLAGAPPGAAA